MTDYFFISSPLHFLIAANIALGNPNNERILVIMARAPKAAERFRTAAAKHPNIFNRVVVLPYTARRTRTIRSPRFRAIASMLSAATATRIFTGNDRRLEFQYAMHIASRNGHRPEGIYMDEGAVTYVGHKSMHRIAHRHLDPLVKRLILGRWYKPALTTGASDWIDTIYAAFPEHVHPLLKGTPCAAIAAQPFALTAFKALAKDMLPADMNPEDTLGGVKVVITLPHEASYINTPQTYETVSRLLLDHFEPSNVAIKPHPRMTNQRRVEQIFPGATILDPSTGMEALLPLLDDDCLIAGDISSTLLTTKWLRPTLPIVALMVHKAPPERMTDLYKALKIPMVMPKDLPAWLSSALPAIG